MRRSVSNTAQKLRHVLNLLQSAAVEVVAPAERDNTAPAKEAVKLEWREIETFDLSNELLLFGVVNELGRITEPGG